MAKAKAKASAPSLVRYEVVEKCWYAGRLWKPGVDSPVFPRSVKVTKHFRPIDPIEDPEEEPEEPETGEGETG